MNDIETAIERHLGVRVDASSLTHYQLLGVNPNATVDEIKQGLRTAANSWNKSDTKGNPESSQLVAKLLKQAQSTLLDPVKRKEYDLSISRNLVSTSTVSSRSIFPDMDPFLDFAPGECLVGAATIDAYSEKFGSVNERWQALQRELPELLHATRQTFEPEMDDDEASDDLIESARPSSRTDSTTTRLAQIKRARVMRQRWTIALVLGLSTIFLGYAGIRFAINRQQLHEQKLAKADDTVGDQLKIEGPEKSFANESKVPSKSNPQTKPVTGQRSGLPSISRGDGTDSNESGTSTMASDKMGMSPSPTAVSPAKSPEATPSAVVPPAEAKPEMAAPRMDAKPAETKPAEPKPEDKPKPESEPSMASNATNKEWVAAMKKAREAIDKADFETFQKQMDIASPLSSNDEMIAKQKRLDQLGQLYEIFIKAVREAKSKTRGTEVITVAKSKVNIVEVKEKELVVRVQGKNERYAWDRLPPGIALALADLTLSDEDPTDIAARAVYFSLSPTRNDLFAKKIQGWFDKSLGKGSILKDLPQALTDKYE